MLLSGIVVGGQIDVVLQLSLLYILLMLFVNIVGVVVNIVVNIVDVVAHQERQGHAATAAPSLLPAAGSHPPPLLFCQSRMNNSVSFVG